MTLTPEQIADGWVEHDGSVAPADIESIERVMFRFGDQSADPCDYGWPHLGLTGDIIAYKRKPTPMPEGVTPELVERMVAFLQDISDNRESFPTAAHNEARAILADMKPVDPLLAAMDVAYDAGARWSIDSSETRQEFADAVRKKLARHGLTIKQEGGE